MNYFTMERCAAGYRNRIVVLVFECAKYIHYIIYIYIGTHVPTSTCRISRPSQSSFSCTKTNTHTHTLSPRGVTIVLSPIVPSNKIIQRERIEGRVDCRVRVQQIRCRSAYSIRSMSNSKY